MPVVQPNVRQPPETYSGILAAGDADEDGTGGWVTFAGYVNGLSFCTGSGTGKVNVAYSGRMGD
jgi:hypothetical protein